MIKIRTTLLATIILGFLWQGASGKAWNEYLDRADSLSKAANYDSAITLGTFCLRMVEEEYGGEDTVTAQVLYNLGKYYNQNTMYSKAKPLIERSLEIRKNTFGVEHIEVARSLYNLASNFLGMGKYSEAETLLRQSLSMCEKLPDADPEDIVNNLNQLTTLFIKMSNTDDADSYSRRAMEICEGMDDVDIEIKCKSQFHMAVVCIVQFKYAEGESLVQQVLETYKSKYGMRHPFLCNLFRVLAIAHLGQGKPTEAEESINQSVAIGSEIFPPDHLGNAGNFVTFGMLRLMQGSFADADSLCRKSLEIMEKVLGPEHPDVASALTCIGTALRYQGKYEEAEPLFERALAVKERSMAGVSGEMASSLNNLAASYYDAGKYVEAESLFIQSLNMFEKVSGSDNPDLALYFINLAAFYVEMGRYAKADSLMRQSATIIEGLSIEEFPFLAQTWMTLGVLHATQGRYAEADSLLELALGFAETSHSVNQLVHAQIMHNIAIINCWQNKYSEAEPIMIKALEAYRNIGEEDHPESAGCLNILGAIYNHLGDYEKAENAFLEGLAIREKSHGPNHYFVSANLDNIGELYAYQGRYEEAISLHERAMNIRKNVLGENHPYHADALETYSNLLRLQQDWSSSLAKTARAFKLRQDNFRKNCYILSEKDALAYSQKLKRCTNNFLSCYHDSDLPDSSIALQAANIIISCKGQVSDEVIERRKPLITESDSAVVLLADSLRRIQYELSHLFVHGPGDDTTGTYRKKLDSLSNLAERVESDLARQSASFRKFQNRQSVDSRSLCSSLPSNAILIEFYKYDYVRFNSDQSEQRYVAIVFSPDAQPKVVELGGAAEIDPVIERYRNHFLSLAGSGRSPSIIDQQEYLDISKNLYNRIWQPLDIYTDNSEMVFIAPDGALNLVSFAGLANDREEYLTEIFSIHYLSSGRDLIRPEEEVTAGTSLFAMGDPDYNAPVQARVSGSDALENAGSSEVVYAMRGARSGCGELKNITVTPLPGTRQEIQQITAKWRSTREEPAVVYYGADASEERFKSEAPGNRIIHLATHGYYLQGVCQDNISRHGFDMGPEYAGENPLLLSGLFLAGANLQGESTDIPESEDGILTAYEVSAMNFAGTELVVLSACETGLGKVREGEGVYGLRRAFQMAGARTVISALWSVSDEVTAEMMSQMYNRQDATLPETLRRIQLDKISELRDRGEIDHPFTWGAFIALGDWR